MAKSKRLTIKEQEAERYHYQTIIKSLHGRLKYQAVVYMIAMIIISILGVIIFR